MNATRLWPIVEQKYKGYAGYQQRTDREIPLIFLDRGFVIEPRAVTLDREAILALAQILGIMLDRLFDGDDTNGWNSEHIIDLEARLTAPIEENGVLIGIDDAALLLHGMAYTEVMSEHLPWIDSVRWVADFVTQELRQYWTEDEWQRFTL